MVEEQDVAKLFAVQTAIIALLVEILIDAEIVHKEDLIEDLNAMRHRLMAEGGALSEAGPLMHLLRLVEQL